MKYLFFFMPEIPAGECLEEQHLQTILYCGSMFFSLLHEKGFVRIVDEIVEQRVGVHRLVRQRRALIYMRIHTYRRTIHDDIVFLFKECEQKAVLSESLNYKIDEKEEARSQELESKINNILSGDNNLDVYTLMRILQKKLNND